MSSASRSHRLAAPKSSPNQLSVVTEHDVSLELDDKQRWGVCLELAWHDHGKTARTARLMLTTMDAERLALLLAARSLQARKSSELPAAGPTPVGASGAGSRYVVGREQVADRNVKGSGDLADVDEADVAASLLDRG